MKTFVKAVIFFFAIMSLSTASASPWRKEVQSVLAGKGSTSKAVEAFRKAVIQSGGEVDNNATTKTSAVGKFMEGCKATMISEAVKGGVEINIKYVCVAKGDVIMALGNLFANVDQNYLESFASKVENKMVAAGYPEPVMTDELKKKYDTTSVQ